jgi:GGDEF domain-containing protein
LARKVLTAFDQPFQFGGHELRVTASIGISLYPRDGRDAQVLLSHADIAMYRAKRFKNAYMFFDDATSSSG